MGIVMVKVKDDLAPGPWGEAIQYWLTHKGIRQSDLARSAKLPQNTISGAARGIHMTTRILARIAEALDVPLSDVLVSPARNSDEDEWKAAIAAQVHRWLVDNPRLLATRGSDLEKAFEVAKRDIERREQRAAALARIKKPRKPVANRTPRKG